MKASSLLNLTLALLTALWSPAWCCCAKAADARPSITAPDSHVAAQCPRCHADRNLPDAPAAPVPAPDQCPHAAARSLATIEQPPRFDLPLTIAIDFAYPVIAVIQPHAPLIRVSAADDLAPPAGASLLALRCMHLI